MHIQSCLFDVVNPLLCIKNRWVFFIFVLPYKKLLLHHTYMHTYIIKWNHFKKAENWGFFSKSYLAFKIVRVWGIYDYYKCKKFFLFQNSKYLVNVHVHVIKKKPVCSLWTLKVHVIGTIEIKNWIEYNTFKAQYRVS